MRVAPELVAGLAALVLSAGPGAAGEAVYRVRGPQLPIAVAGNGYVQTVTKLADDGVEVRVSALLGPVGDTTRYRGAGSFPVHGVPEGFTLPDRLAEHLRSQLSAWEAATRVQEWVVRHVRLDDEDEGPQDAGSVLARGGGRCSGVANATVALLMAAGFEARTRSGLLVTDDGPVPHRWLECRLPGVGWVPSDPTLGLWIVTPRHLVFDQTVGRQPEVEVVRLADSQLSSLPRRGGRPVRPNTGASLLCRLASRADSTVVATLRGPGGDVRRAVLDPVGEFSGLLPGRWLLEVARDREILERARLTLVEDQVHSFTVDLAGPS